MLLCAAALAPAQQQFAPLGDFPLENGERILDCTVGYRMYGTLDITRSNAVLFPTWLGGRSVDLERLIGEDKLLDTTRYCVIAVDAFGNGVSSSPSNSLRQPNRQFPLFSIRDMVRSQYKLLTSVLGIQHLRCIIGGSMGGMQVFEWATLYPKFMDAAIPYVGTPRLTSYDCLLWRTELYILDSLGTGSSPATLRYAITMINSLAVQTPAYRVSQTAPEDLAAYLASASDGFRSRFHPDDWRSQLRAMLAHDITTRFGGSLALAAAAVEARMLVVVASQDHTVNPEPALTFASMASAETLVLRSDCGHLAPSCQMDLFRQAIIAFLR